MHNEKGRISIQVARYIKVQKIEPCHMLHYRQHHHRMLLRISRLARLQDSCKCRGWARKLILSIGEQQSPCLRRFDLSARSTAIRQDRGRKTEQRVRVSRRSRDRLVRSSIDDPSDPRPLGVARGHDGNGIPSDFKINFACKSNAACVSHFIVHTRGRTPCTVLRYEGKSPHTSVSEVFF